MKRVATDQLGIEPPAVGPGDVRASIGHALERRAEREASRVVVEVVGDRVILSGLVRSWAEREAIIGAAKGTRGVRDVVSRLQVEPYAG